MPDLRTPPLRYRLRFPAVLIVVLALSSADAAAQTASLRGFVTDAGDGRPLELATAAIQSLEGATSDGVYTSAEGVYSFARLEPGRYAVQISFLGYQTYADTIDLAPGDLRTLNVALEPSEALLDEVVVEEERTAAAARVIAGQQTIRPEDLEAIPAPDLSADLVGFVAAQPGVVTSGDRGGQLFIRGGEPSQNLVLLDGMTLYQPFHMLGFYSSFPADVLRKADLYAGGYGARYGGRVSSVLDVQTRNGNDRRFGGSASFSPFVSAVLLEGPILPGKASFLLSARRSFLEEAAEPVTGVSLPYTFGDAIAKLHVVPSSTVRVSVTGLNTFDRGTLVEGSTSERGEELRWRNQAFGTRIIMLPRMVGFVGEFQLSYSRLTSEQGPQKNPTRTSNASEGRAAFVGTHYVGSRLSTEVGAFFDLIALNSDLGGEFQNTVVESSSFHNTGFYLEPDIHPIANLSIRPGVRFHFYRLDSYPHVEPRLRIVYADGIHQISAAAGLYNQELVGFSDRRDATGVFTAWTNTPGSGARDGDIRAGRLTQSRHAILGYGFRGWKGIDFSIEGYVKSFENLFVPEWTAYPRFTTRLQPAGGRSRGFDVRLSLGSERLYANASYGYSSTRYAAERARFVLWYGEESLDYRPAHDRRHQVAAQLGASLLGFDASARWQFGSGLPFSRAAGFDGFILLEGPDADLAQPGTRRIIYERPFNGVLPTFHRLDVAIERTFDLRMAALTLQASAINTYDRRNLFYLDVFTLRRSDQLPFVPSFGVKIATK